MIAMTRENGVTVRLNADYDVEKLAAAYIVWASGAKFRFGTFAEAANLYNDLTKSLSDGNYDEALNRAKAIYLRDMKEVA